MRRIGVLYFTGLRGRAGEIGPVFARALENLGWKEGQNLQIDTRSADADAGKVGPLAKELVDLKPDVLLASNTLAALALQQATQTIPIVFVAVGNPIGSGLVTNLARPGANITGFTNMEPSVAGKRVELLKAIVPSLTRIVAMYHEPTIFAASGQRAFDEAARRNAIEPVLAQVRSKADITRVITELGTSRTSGLYVNGEPFLGDLDDNRDLVISLCAQHRVPAVYVFRFFTAAGGLISYGNDLTAYRQAADYVDRILRGAAPGDLPVQLPSKLELVINLKTANALGISISPSLLATADEVIE